MIGTKWITVERRDTLWSYKFNVQKAKLFACVNSMNPSCPVSAAPAGGSIMWGMFSSIYASFIHRSVPKYCEEQLCPSVANIFLNSFQIDEEAELRSLGTYL